MKFGILVILVSLVLFGCNFEAPVNPNALTEAITVENKEVGWKIEVPAGWEMKSEEEAEVHSQNGLEKIEETLNQEITADGLLHLLHITKNESNILAVTAEPFLEEYINEWELNNELLREILLATYENQGMPAEMSAITTEDVNGINFITYSILITRQDGNTVKQRIYSTFHNGHDLSVSITYLDESMKDEMISIWKSSEFKVKEKTAAEKAHYAKMDSDFNLYISKGDGAFEQETYGEAMFWYEMASLLNPASEYAINQFEVCNEKGDDNSYATLEVLRQYQNVIDKADALFKAKNYSEAKTYYERALDLDPSHQYPKDQIILITDTILKMDYPEDWKP
jgi:tetratricopeptide (TPR) repeat protein